MRSGHSEASSCCCSTSRVHTGDECLVRAGGWAEGTLASAALRADESTGAAEVSSGAAPAFAAEELPGFARGFRSQDAAKAARQLNANRDERRPCMAYAG